MAKTGFSSSSPLAGSFLTGLICPSAAMLCRGGLSCIGLFLQLCQKAFCAGVLSCAVVYCACVFYTTAWAYGNETNMN